LFPEAKGWKKSYAFLCFSNNLNQYNDKQGVFCDVTPFSFDVRYQRFGGKKSQRRHNLEGNSAELLPRETQISLIFRPVSKPKL